MPTMVVLSLAGLSLLAVLVLVLAIYVSNSSRLHNTRARSHPVKAKSKASSNGGSSCETCHMCGGLRLRSSHAVDPAAVLDDAKSSQLQSSTHFAVTDDAPRLRSRPRPDHWATMIAQISLSIKQAVQTLISHQRRQTHGDLLKRLASFSRFSRRQTGPETKAMCLAPGRVSTTGCSSASSASSCQDSSSGGIVSDAISVAAKTAAASTSTSLGPPTLSSESAISGTFKVQDAQRTADIDPQGTPIHRLVLEILVSPSGNTDARAQNRCSTSAPGLTLKLETNATLECLAGCAEALKSEDAKTREHAASVARVLCLPGDVMSKLSGTLCASGDQGSPSPSQVLDGGVLMPDVGISCSNFCSTNLDSGGKLILDTILGNRDCCDASQMGASLDLKDCGQCGHSLGKHLERESIEAMVLRDAITATGKHSTINGQLKLRIGNHMSQKVASDVALSSTNELKEGTSVSEASLLPLDGLGSFRTTFLKSDAECRLQEGADKSNSRVGSPLASLNVTGNLSGGSCLSNTKKEKLNKSCVQPENSCSHCPKSAVKVGQGSGSVCRKNLVEGEEHSLLHALADTSPNGDLDSSSKKERKKKKNRGKRQKVKTETLVADAQEKQEIGKVALEAVKHVSAVPEREIGCICGALRGDLHTESCPYPFTSSGSMLQRKIKEQYNQLVRSNAAKTLTLAQVGQFTTCLVEAKATLQQKSESIQRKFTIAKSLLLKADKSSFDRLCGQIYGLEMEQKKLEEDTVVYNRLQEQLKLSLAYKKMLEYGRAHFELQPHTGQMIEKLEPEDSEMSFEELLAQEKKDAFWQKHSLARSAVPAS